MTKPIAMPARITAQMLSTGDKVNAREVEHAGKLLLESAEGLARREANVGTGHIQTFTHRQQLDQAVDLLERIGAGEVPTRRQDFPESLLDALEKAPVTDKARGVAARHGSLLRDWLDAHPPRSGSVPRGG